MHTPPNLTPLTQYAPTTDISIRSLPTAPSSPTVPFDRFKSATVAEMDEPKEALLQPDKRLVAKILNFYSTNGSRNRQTTLRSQFSNRPRWPK